MRVAPLGRPTVKAGPSYGEWHYPPELPHGWIVARRMPGGWRVRFKDGSAPVREEMVTESDFSDRSSTVRVAAALALLKRTPMMSNPDQGEKRPNYLEASRKGLSRVRTLAPLFGKLGAKVGFKSAVKVGAKVGVKTGAKAIPVAGQVLMVIDALPEAYRVEKEKVAALRTLGRDVKQAQGFKETMSAMGRGAGEYGKLTTMGSLRVGAAAFVGSDVVHSFRKKNPQDYQAEIARMLQNMPAEWTRQYNSGRGRLAEAGGPKLPSSPTPQQAMSIIGITAGGRSSGDEPVGSIIIPQQVRDEAMHGLRLSYKNNYGAWDFIGIARAIQLAISPGVSPTSQKRMRNYFSRHRKDAQSARWGSESNPSRGWMAWLNWGGDAGQQWVSRSNPVSTSMRSTMAFHNPFYNPYHKEGRDPWGKVCFYIFNDDGTPVLTGSGTPQWCYKVEKAAVMIAKAERSGYRVSGSATSPGPRPATGPFTPPAGSGPFGGGTAGPSSSPSPSPAPSGFVRERIQEQAAKPITHSYKIGDVIVSMSAAINTVQFFSVISVSPASVMVKAIGSRKVSGSPYVWESVPDASVEGHHSRSNNQPFRLMLDGDKIKGSDGAWSFYKRWDGAPVRESVSGY